MIPALLLRFLPHLLIVVGALAAIGWFSHSRYEAGYEAHRIESEAAAERQREANRSTAREAEEKEAVKTVYRDRYIIKTVTEIRDAAQSLAACPVPLPVVGMLNRAAECAANPGAATCGADGPMPGP